MTACNIYVPLKCFVEPFWDYLPKLSHLFVVGKLWALRSRYTDGNLMWRDRVTKCRGSFVIRRTIRTLLCFINDMLLPHSTFQDDISCNGDDGFEMSVFSEATKKTKTWVHSSDRSFARSRQTLSAHRLPFYIDHGSSVVSHI